MSLWIQTLVLVLVLVDVVPYCMAYSNTIIPTPTTTIQVCQDKNCCKRFSGRAADLVQTLRQLSPASCTIESTTCLSHCDQGPNVRLITASKDDRVEHDVHNAPAAAAMLELLFEDDSQPQQLVHPTLLAAASVMERAYKATTKAEKERFLNSVVTALKKNDALARSNTMAHALVMRARLNDPHTARNDALRATQLDPSHPHAWRVLVDASPEDPTQALMEWAKHQPQFQTKVTKELALWREKQRQNDVSV